MNRFTIDFESPDLVKQIERLSPEQVDQLHFGVVRLNAVGNVESFSKREQQMSGWSKQTPIGLDFFSQVAPCMAGPGFKGAIDAAVVAGTLDAEFLHTGDFADRDREIRVRALSASDGGVWLFLLRDDVEAAV